MTYSLLRKKRFVEFVSNFRSKNRGKVSQMYHAGLGVYKYVVIN